MPTPMTVPAPPTVADRLDVTVTIASQRVVIALTAGTPSLPPGVRAVHWDLTGPLPDGVAPADVDMVVLPNRGMTEADRTVLAGLPHLRVVQLSSAGYEHALPLLPPGLVLCNGRGVHDAGTAELAVGLVLASQRGIDDAVRAMPAGRWAPTKRSSLADRRAVVVGAGAIGSAIRRRLEVFEVEVVMVGRTARDEPDGTPVHARSELPDLVADADVVVLVLPLTPDTERIADADLLARMPDGALLVNVGRGRLVDTDALVAEVRAGRLRAALDVTEPEPLPSDHPLWTAPGVIITPHLGGSTDATIPRLAELLRRQLDALAAGEEPLNVVART